MKPNKINYTSQLQINDLIDNAVVNAIARRSSWETLSDDEAARVAGGQTIRRGRSYLFAQRSYLRAD
jgi:hypothetical protein